MVTAQSTKTPTEVVQPTTSGLATASLFLGLASLCFGLLASIPGFVLGILGLREVNRSQGSRRGKGLAIAGMLLSLLGVLVQVTWVLVVLFAVVWGKPTARDAQARLEIAQMSTAMGTFYSRFGTYPPSNLQLGPINGIDPQSRQFILKCWPRISPSVTWGPMAGRLSGDQVLVWALGGMQSSESGSGRCLGFSDDPSDPTRPGGKRIGPFFGFQSNRLRIVGGRSARAFSYLDPYSNDVPYLYFAAAPTGNSYTPDCSAVTNNKGVSSGPVLPYFNSTNPIGFINPTSYQIICAGKDGVFGPGGQWTPATARTVYPPGTAGSDDLSNFHPRPLGEK
jgi:hypothetical protein